MVNARKEGRIGETELTGKTVVLFIRQSRGERNGKEQVHEVNKYVVNLYTELLFF